MSAKYKSPSFLLPNELNTSANTANDTGVNSLYSMEFDGSNYIDCGLGVAGITGAYNADLSISAWFKKSSCGVHAIFGNDSPTGGYGQGHLSLYDSSNTITFSCGTNARLKIRYQYNNDSCPSFDSNWHHVVGIMTYSSGSFSLQMYFDGNSVGTTTGSAGTNQVNFSYNSYIGSLGQNVNNSRYFDGQIDEVAIFNRALNTTEIAALYDSTGSNIRPSNLIASNLNPIAYYPLGEQAQNTGYLSATGNEWQFPNGVLQDYVIDFDSTSPGDAITSNTSGITGNTARTVSFWYNIGISSSAMIPFSLGGINDTNSNSQFAYCINRQDSLTTAAIFGRGGNDISPITVPATNDSKWHNVIITYTGSTLALYIDGSNITLPSQPSSYATTDGFKIGGWSEADNRLFDGQLSNVAIWNTAITDSAQIAKIYNNGSPQTSYTVTPQNWWKLNADSVYTPSAPNYTTALDFDNPIGTNNGVIYAPTTLPSTSAWSVSFWSRREPSNQKKWFWSAGSSSNGAGIYNESGQLRFTGTAAGDISMGSTPFAVADLFHMVASYDGSTLKVYIDGSEFYSGSVTTNIGTGYITIGGWNRYGYPTGGAYYSYAQNEIMSNFAVWDSALTASQASTLFNFGTPENNISFSPRNYYKLDNTTTGLNDLGSGGANASISGTGITQVNTSVAVVPSWKIPSALTIKTPNYTTALDFISSSTTRVETTFNALTSVGANNDFTVSAWVKPDNATSPNKQRIFGSLGGNGSRFWLGIRGGAIRMAYGSVNGHAFSGSDLLLSESWSHVAVTYNNSTGLMTAYINGEQQGTSTHTGTTTPSNANAWIGNIANDSSVPFNGELSNIAVYNTELSSSNIATLYNSGTPQNTIFGSPVGWWKLDNLTTGIQDSSGNGNNGTNNGAAQVTSDVVTPQPVNGVSTTLPSTALQQSDLQFDSPYSNYSLYFNNTASDRISIPYVLPAGTTKFSVSIWGNVEGAGSSVNKCLIAQQPTGGLTSEGFSIFTEGTYPNTKVWFKIENNTSTQTTSNIVFGEWFHILATYDSGTAKIYFNGVLENTTTGVTSPLTTANTTQTILGSLNPSGITIPMLGHLDEAAIWETVALTDAQVLQIYNNGKPNNISSLSPTNWWRLGENAYFDNNAITVPNSITGAPNGTGSGTVTSMLSADAPGTYANGVGTDLDIVDRVGDAALSTANSQSYNMIPDDKVPYVPGYIGNQINNTYSMTFDGVDDYIDLGTYTQGTGLALNADMSISAWIKTSNLTTTQVVICNLNSSASAGGYCIEMNREANGQYGILYDDQTVGLQGSTILSSNTWYHIVMTRTGTSGNWSYNLYLNGNADGSATNVAQNFDNGSVAIGRFGAYNGGYFNGSIDEVAIFNTALSADQIKFDLYKPTSEGTNQTADIANNPNLPTPVAWYRMGD